jgi:hypothetical protein
MYIYKIIDIKYVFFSLKSHCRFWQNKNIYSWDDAYRDCKARNMELAKIDSQSELDAAILYMNAQS